MKTNPILAPEVPAPAEPTLTSDASDSSDASAPTKSKPVKPSQTQSNQIQLPLPPRELCPTKSDQIRPTFYRATANPNSSKTPFFKAFQRLSKKNLQPIQN